MPTQGGFSLSVVMNGISSKEHAIDGHSVIGSKEGSHFEVHVGTTKPVGLYIVEICIGKQEVGIMHCFDPKAVITSRSYSRSLMQFSYWARSSRKFFFDSAKDDEASRPTNLDWTMGKIEARIYQAKVHMFHCDTKVAQPRVSTKQVPTVGNKKGLSTTAGHGDTVSKIEAMPWKQGETAAVKASNIPLTTLELYYRDSLWMAMQEDSCCGGMCAQRAASSRKRPLEAKEEAKETKKEPPEAGTSSKAGKKRIEIIIDD